MKTHVFKQFFIVAIIFAISTLTLDFSMQKGFTVSMQSADARDGHFDRSGHGNYRRGHNGHKYRDYHRGRHGHYDNYYRYRTPVGVGGVILIGTFISTLPQKCYKEYAYGRLYYHCGPNYYRRSGNGYIVVEAP